MHTGLGQMASLVSIKVTEMSSQTHQKEVNRNLCSAHAGWIHVCVGGFNIVGLVSLAHFLFALSVLGTTFFSWKNVAYERFPRDRLSWWSGILCFYHVDLQLFCISVSFHVTWPPRFACDCPAEKMTGMYSLFFSCTVPYCCSVAANTQWVHGM